MDYNKLNLSDDKFTFWETEAIDRIESMKVKDSDKPLYLYWISKKQTSIESIYSTGYVGISVDCKERYKSHIRPTSKSYVSKKLQSNGVENYTMQIIAKGTNKEIRALEYTLRPESNIGLNRSIGGGGYPTITEESVQKAKDSRLKGGYFSEENKLKRGQLAKEAKEKRGSYKSESFLEKKRLREESRKESNYYDSEEWKAIAKSRQDAKEQSGWYNTPEWQLSLKKREETRRKNDYYNSPRFKELQAQRIKTRRSRNVQYNKSIYYIDADTKNKVIYSDYYSAAEAFNTKATHIAQSIRGGYKHKNIKWKLTEGDHD